MGYAHCLQVGDANLDTGLQKHNVLRVRPCAHVWLTSVPDELGLGSMGTWAHAVVLHAYQLVQLRKGLANPASWLKARERDVLARTEKSAKNKRKKGFFLDVQILSLDKKIKVKSTGAQILKKSHIEGIASSLALQNEVAAAPLEELAYRRSLRVALDRSPRNRPPRSATPALRLCSTKTRRAVLGTRGGNVRPRGSRPPSEESVELNAVNALLAEDEEEEDEEPPRILLYHEPRSFEVGMLVWLKYQKYPFWPAVVKSVRRRDKKASVLFIEGNMNPKGRGITVSLRRLKHFDCKEKQALLDEAKEDFDQAIGWCVSLITDYRVRLGCGSFAGSFLEYYAADISSPVRKSIQRDVQGTRFPPLSGVGPEEASAGSPRGRRPACRKVLPDRSRAARDRANQKLVEYITYLEDEEQLDLVVKYLQGVYQEAGSRLLARGHGDGIRFVLDVLLPEAIICAISAVDAVDYKTAEEKYIRGPSLSYR
ncbi:hypothetical protein E2I00_006607 [Balaenoptera physalus]|uniref:PWWP domain-containing protein n=1 Tax=Balaenoptera physalus TaxID=9770 RepID=A0A643BST0_BALPH|nr:hypothetical protein E2I00_006607 [Balaenoptera physalus]